jgi:catechol-2,3-dioxygenase
MKPAIKAVVFRTPMLITTKAFFRDQLGLVIREQSVTHFVIHSKGTRILFVETTDDPKVEIYVENALAGKLTVLEDPNHIKIIISQKPQQ